MTICWHWPGMRGGKYLVYMQPQRLFSLKYTHAYKKVQHSNWLLKISDHKGLLRTTLKHCSRLFDLKWMDWTKAVRPFHLPKWDSLWQSDKREMARKTLQYGWLLSRADELLMRKSSLGLSRYTRTWRRSNWANEQKKRLLSQERVRTARPAYRHESLSELMMIQLYDAFTPVVSIWKDWILSKAAANMVFIALALSFWMCLLYFWVIIPCIHYVFADSPISRKKRWFTCCLGRISVKSVFVF